MTHEFLSIYPAKLMEYGLAILYLLLFVPFWSYVQGARRTAKKVTRVTVAAPRPASSVAHPVRPVAARAHAA
jgi:glycine cleavage system H protein